MKRMVTTNMCLQRLIGLDDYAYHVNKFTNNKQGLDLMRTFLDESWLSILIKHPGEPSGVVSVHHRSLPSSEAQVSIENSV